MKLIKLLSLVIIALVVANVTLTNRTVDDGVVLSNLNKEITDLQNETTILKSKVSAAGAIGNLSAKLAEAGFVETGKVVALSSHTSVASR